MTYEYETTFAVSVPAIRMIPPIQPAGDGWEMIGSDVLPGADVSTTSEAPLTVILTKRSFWCFWYWRRRVDGRTCRNPACGSIATKNGQCVACGESVS